MWEENNVTGKLDIFTRVIEEQMNLKTFAQRADGQVQNGQNQNQNWENVIMFRKQTFIRLFFFLLTIQNIASCNNCKWRGMCPFFFLFNSLIFWFSKIKISTCEMHVSHVILFCDVWIRVSMCATKTCHMRSS